MDMQRVCFSMHSMKVTDVCSRNAAMRVDGKKDNIMRFSQVKSTDSSSIIEYGQDTVLLCITYRGSWVKRQINTSTLVFRGLSEVVFLQEKTKSKEAYLAMHCCKDRWRCSHGLGPSRNAWKSKVPQVLSS